MIDSIAGPGVTPASAEEKPRLGLGRLLATTLRTGQIPIDLPWGRAFAFGLLFAQCVLLFWVLRRFRIENELFRLLVAVALGGFVVNHLLPRRFRLAFFSSLSIGLILLAFGLNEGKWLWTDSLARGAVLFGVGFCLIGVCRLPVAFGYRVAMLLAAACGLAVFRGGWATLAPLDAIWPPLGAMFMFRVISYLYDVEHEKTKTSILQAMAYLFLFPALWLFVFPVIDYKTFVKSHYAAPAEETYQRGLRWMFRGVIQLLLWRFVYYEVYVDPARIADGADLAKFLLANIGLYLRVTGHFHFAIGLLLLFGFNLPATNNKYFIAADFIDYWRRANIYMREFLMKVCYYPLVVRFKKLGPTKSIVAAIIGVFLATWFMHPFQTFWLSGTFPLAPKDALFWGLLCAGVIYSSLRPAQKPGALAESERWPAALRLALATGVTFTLVTTLWSIWTSDDLEQWISIWRFADRMTVAIWLAAVTAVMAARILLDSPVSPWVEGGKKPPERKPAGLPWRVAVVTCFVPGFLLVAASSDLVFSRLSDAQKKVAQSFFSNTPNKAGEEFLTRGYYENIMDTARVSPMLEGALRRQPSNWQLLESTAAVRETVDLRTREMDPNVDLVVNGVPFRSNEWGMRDREYPLAKPAGAVRVAVLGSSITMGWNVPKERTFEDLLETRLNRGKGDTVEIWNFAVNGYSIVSLVEQLERKVLRFHLDAVIVVSHPEDPGRAVYMLARSISMGASLAAYPFLEDLVREAGIQAGDPRNRIERKLAPHGERLTRWAYERLASLCRENGIRAWLVYLPGVLQREIGPLDHRLVEIAREVGFDVMPLFDVYSGVDDRAELMVAAWDAHPNAAGHARIADALEAALASRIESIRQAAAGAGKGRK